MSNVSSCFRFKFLVFSAYFDHRDGNRMIRVVGATKTRMPERVFCRFWYPRDQQKHLPEQYLTVPGKVRCRLGCLHWWRTWLWSRSL